MITIPFLVILAMVLGIYGGRLAGTLGGILSGDTYDRGLLLDFIPKNVWFALVKAYTFAFIISSVSSFYGYNVKGGSLEIGRASTIRCNYELYSYFICRLYTCFFYIIIKWKMTIESDNISGQVS